MKPNQIIIGEHYRHKDSPNGYAKVIELLPPRIGMNKSTSTLAKCEWATVKDSDFGFIRYFKVSNLRRL